MISIADIYRIVSSRAAKRSGIHSTDDLFQRDPPLVEVFFNSEYGLYLPYIRFAADGGDPRARPEDAPGSVCPFLVPIKELFAFQGKEVPAWAGKQAMGCILGRHKPKICRLSPVGKSMGLVTGRESYEYAPPSLDCPACDTNVSVKVADYLADAELPGEKRLDEHSHRILISTAKRALDEAKRRRFNQILQQLYNIDGLLFQHGLEVHQRPGLERVVEIGVRAARGDFAAYEGLIAELSQAGRSIATHPPDARQKRACGDRRIRSD